MFLKTTPPDQGTSFSFTSRRFTESNNTSFWRFLGYCDPSYIGISKSWKIHLSIISKNPRRSIRNEGHRPASEDHTLDITLSFGEPSIPGRIPVSAGRQAEAFEGFDEFEEQSHQNTGLHLKMNRVLEVHNYLETCRAGVLSREK
jgi:hypothetical protein